MDPTLIALAAKTVAILRPYVAKTATEFISTVGQTGHDRAKALLDRLRSRWAGDVGSTVVLDQFEQDPDTFERPLDAILQRQLADDSEFREEVESAIEELGPTLEIFQRMGVGENVTGLEADELARGKVSVRQEIDQGSGITGARLGRIG